MGRPPGFRVPKSARSRGPSRATAPPENRQREGDRSVGVAGPPRDPSEDDRVQGIRAVGSGSAEHVGGTAGAQPVHPRKPGPAGLGRIIFLWGTSGLPRCKEDHGWRRQYHRQQHPRCPRRQPRSGPFQCILGRDRLPMKRGMTVQWWLVPVEGHKRDPRHHRGGLALHFGCWDLAEASWGAAATGRIA
jgi:hypothetical protein